MNRYRQSLPGAPTPMAVIECAMTSYGRLSLLKTTIETFKSTRDNRVRLTVVDNGSKSDVRHYLLDNIERPDNLFLLAENQGKPHAWNLVANMMTARPLKYEEPELLLFLDSDLEFLPGWIDVMIETWHDHCDSSLGALSGFASHREINDLAQGPRRSYKRLRFPAGCCMLMTPTIFKDIGPFDQERLIRAVDTNYYRRLKAKGYSVGCVHPASCIVHTGRQARTWSIGTAMPIYRP